ncbi:MULTISPECIES: hypothetical protein [unclassified Streptomyces]|uniref:hypothetical protein n=1 Tax=unclassified Streptomyces TaxID=2593676 RepID=UPI001C0CB650|nr:hypothetical protein [Streptomyces sp. YPW6]QWQ42903.1 hypothetical protein KME66_19370 [Streptomyces sp. YPW6]
MRTFNSPAIRTTAAGLAAGGALLLSVAGLVYADGAGSAVAGDDPWTSAPVAVLDDPWTSAPAAADDPWT